MEIISIREFARRMGVDDKTIRKAIQVGKITAVTSKGVDFGSAKKEFEAIGIGRQKKLKEVTVKARETPANVTDITDDASFIEACRVEKVNKARITVLEAAILSKKYVSVEDLRIELNEFTSTIRRELEQQPYRVVPKIVLAKSDSMKITEIIAKDIHDTLLRIIKQCSAIEKVD